MVMISDRNVESMDVFLFRAGAKTSAPPVEQRLGEEFKAGRAWTPADGAYLSEEGRNQISKLRDMWLLPNGPFDVVLCGNAPSTIESAQLAFPNHKLITDKKWEEVDLEEHQQVIIIDKRWNEVKLKNLENKSPTQIKELYKEYNPEKEVPTDPNDCMYSRWPVLEDKPEVKFEPYCEFRERMLDNFSQTYERFAGKKIAWVGNCENWRDSLMLATATSDFYETEFGQKIGSLNGYDVEEALGNKIKRSTFKPCYAGGLRLKVTACKVEVIDCFGKMDKPL